MAAEAPRGGAVQTCAGERGEAEFVLAGGDVLNNSLKGFKVGDLAYLMAGLFKQGLVDYKTIGLIAISDAVNFAVLAEKVEVVGVHFLINIGVLQIQAIVAPSGKACFVAALEQGRHAALVHFGGEGFLIGAACSGNNLHGHAGQLGIFLSQRLPGRIGLGLEVEIIHGALRLGGFGGVHRSRGRLGGGGHGARRGSLSGLNVSVVIRLAAYHGQNHGQHQYDSQNLLHCSFLLK